MDRISEIDSNVIKSLRFPLATIVVFLHSMNVENTPINIIGEWQSGVYDLVLFDTLRVLISRVIGHLAVPTFMVMSGYLFFAKLSEWDWKVYYDKIISRVDTLLVPYFLWNIIPVVITFLWLRHPNLIIDEWNKVLLQGFVGFFFTLPHNAVLWFLRDLIVFVIMSPFVYYIIRKMGCLCIIMLIITNVLITNLTLGALLFFVLGAYLSINEHALVLSLLERRSTIIYLFVIFSLLKLMFYNDLADGLWLYANNCINICSVLFGVAFLFVFFANPKVCALRIPIVVTSSSFLVYVIHMEFLWRTYWVLHKLFPSYQTSHSVAFGIYIVSPIVSLVGIIILNYLLCTYMPRANRILTSNR